MCGPSVADNEVMIVARFTTETTNLAEPSKCCLSHSVLRQICAVGVVEEEMTDDILNRLPAGWFPSDPERASLLKAELDRELPAGHILYGQDVTVIAHREGTDDILCRHTNTLGRYTVIHLSWIGRTEINSQHPWVEADGDFAAFLKYEEGYGIR